MSQKSTRRARRQTTDDDAPPAKPPTPKPNGNAEEPPLEKEKSEEAPPTSTPNGTEEPLPAQDPAPEEPEKQSEKPLANGHEEPPKEEEEADEPDPELVFEEGSDLESGRDSPVISRCKTRRSQTRNAPTPKTPKSGAETPSEEQMEEGEEPEEELNVTFESCSENASTKAQVGGDSTRLDYTESNLESNSFLQSNKNKSFGETLKRLSTRRAIRPIGEDYRKRLLQATVDKDLKDYPTRYSVERVSTVGVKRQNSSEDEESTKRFKSDSPGFFTRLTSPLASIRNPFRADIPSSTPKLTGYKDEKCLLEQDGVNTQLFEVKDGERRWCSIM